MSYSCVASWRLNKGYSTADKQLPEIQPDNGALNTFITHLIFPGDNSNIFYMIIFYLL